MLDHDSDNEIGDAPILQTDFSLSKLKEPIQGVRSKVNRSQDVERGDVSVILKTETSVNLLPITEDVKEVLRD